MLTAFFAVLMVIGVCAVAPSFAQATKRIDFAKEGCCLVWEERVSANSSKSFVFFAKKGQNLSLSFIDDTGAGSMDLGKFSVEPNTDPMEMTIEVTKDYTVTVSNNSNKATSFRISISLEDVKSPSVSDDEIPSDAERIQFPKGSIEVNLEKITPANGAKRFVFWAKAGQEIAFTVTPKNKNATLNIEFSGNDVTPGELFTMIAPKTGDYLLQVLNADTRNQPFNLDLGIAAPADEATENSDGERVKFAAGEDSAALYEREIPANGSIDFIINAKKGQKIGIQMGYESKAGDIKAFLSEPGLQDISLSLGPETRKEFVVKKAGDHRLTVTNNTGKKITFSLYVDIY